MPVWGADLQDTFDNANGGADDTWPERVLSTEAFRRRQAQWWATADERSHVRMHASGLILQLDTVHAVRRVCGDELAARVRRDLLSMLQVRMRESDLLAHIDATTLLLFLKHCSKAHAARVADDLQSLADDYRYIRDGWSIAGRIGTRVSAFSGAQDVEQCVDRASEFEPVIGELHTRTIVQAHATQRAAVLAFPADRPGRIPGSRGTGQGGDSAAAATDNVVPLGRITDDDGDTRLLPVLPLQSRASSHFWLTGRPHSEGSEGAAGESTATRTLAMLVSRLQDTLDQHPRQDRPTFLVDWQAAPPDIRLLGSIDSLLAGRQALPCSLCLMVSTAALRDGLRQWLPFLARWQRLGGDVGLIGASERDSVLQLLSLTGARYLHLDARPAASSDTVPVPPWLAGSGLSLIAGDCDSESDVQKAREQGIDYAIGRAAGRALRLGEWLHASRVFTGRD